MTTQISSFAVIDLETAGLPDFNFNKANITEISIHGFKVEDVSNAINCNEPRINHKLTLLFNPSMMIHPESERITGLNNYMLEHESTFDANAASVIINFLKHLRPPVCLVAHNGDNFDFPILKHTLSKLGLELPSDILCLDSFKAIKSLDLEIESKAASDMDSFIPLPASDSCLKVENLETSLKIEKNLEQIKEKPSLDPLCDSVSDLEVDKLENSSKIDENNEIENNTIISSDPPGKFESPDDWQTFNETTPRRPPNVVNIERKRKRRNEEESCLTPSVPNSRKSLSFVSTTSKIKNYKLSTIYEHMFGNPPPNAHHAEADVVALKKIMLGYGKSFVDYAENNAKPFSEVKKLGAR